MTLSDKGAAGEREDKSGPLICEMLRGAGYDVQKSILLPDEQKEIEKCLCTLCDDEKMDIIFTTGGTGFSPRDCTPEATMAVATRKCAGNRRGHAPRVPEDHSESNAQQRCFRDTELYADHQSAGKPEGGEGEP